MPGFSLVHGVIWDAGAQGTEVPLDTPIPFDAMDQIWQKGTNIYDYYSKGRFLQIF